MKEARLTPELIKELAQYAGDNQVLHCAVYANYVLGVGTGTAKRLFDIYNEVFDAHEYDTYCTGCRMTVFSKLGALYYAAVAEQNTPTTKQTKKAK